MIRLAASVEGQTEEEFINRVLVSHLMSFGVAAQPILLGRGLNSGSGGGDVTMERLVSEMVHLSYSYDAVTSLVDFYGFRNKQDNSVDELENLIRERIEERIDLRPNRVIPYVQRHEFEGLLFSDVNAFSILTDISPNIRALDEMRSKFGTPEDINDNTNTAPSRRIAGAVPPYQKSVHGHMVAKIPVWKGFVPSVRASTIG